MKMKAIISFLFLAVGASAQIINSGGGSGTGTVNAGTTGAPAIYTGNGTTVGPTGTGSVSGAGTISPSGTGQLAASQDWYQSGPGVISPPTPTLAFSGTGGTIVSSSIVYVRLTYVGLAVTEPSGEARITVTGCTGGTQCSVTITMPTSCTAGNLPAGVTGCTAWSSNTFLTELQQTASAACVNITTATCVIGTIGAGSSLTTPQTGITPAGAQASTCPDNIIPTNWMEKSDGNFYSFAGVDVSGLNRPTPAGVFTYCLPVFFNDANAAPIQSNAFVSIHHLECGTTFCDNQNSDRAFGVEMVDAASGSPVAANSLAQYNERIITNIAFNCNPISGGAPWGESCAAAGRFIASDGRASGIGGSFVSALAGVASSTSATVVGTGNANGEYIGVTGGAFEGTTSQNGSAALFLGGQFGANGSTSNTNGTGMAVLAVIPNIRFATQNIGYETQNFGNSFANDWNIESLGGSSGTSKNQFQGAIWLGSLVANNSTIGVTGSLGVTGGVTTTQLTPAMNASVATFGTAGGASNSYKVTCVDSNGNDGVASSAININTSNADLTAAHGNALTFSTTSGANNLGCSSFNVWRTVSGSTCNGGACTNGKLGNVASSSMSSSENYSVGPSFNDTGQVGDGTTAPTINMTGGVKPFNYQTNTNCSSSASPAVCGSAAAGSVAVPTGTNATLQINTTAVTANSQIFMQSDDTLGTRLGVTCNTTLASLIVEPVISTRVAATSFTVTISGTTTVNPVCLSYFIVN